MAGKSFGIDTAWNRWRNEVATLHFTDLERTGGLNDHKDFMVEFISRS